jgi:hypothetical protein
MTGYDREHKEACLYCLTTQHHPPTHHMYLINDTLERAMGINPEGGGKAQNTEKKLWDFE